ncbi:hypothetical protein ORJ04_19850 [Rheinheimera baltica]|uniref:Uncharacterized protein n=1 Tax=Rheinheimera baltica TaxID=67576 RepID=A0ABT9I481_9GAMM|nr:hypothetical protein [Rheinheimera baltica]MDP5138206.1 hypothetical protein [Rheinheimera baltica]MDP5141140.1 hypothetical protein [Rheinheimera baltica]MDP5148369.1 hypothetical protein [Rheinheimera baltica]
MKFIQLTLSALLMLHAAFSSAAEVHQHQSRDIGNMPTPQITLQVFRDATDGVNVHVTTKNYRLNAPDSPIADTSTVLQGHAHIFINGEKRQRLYGEDLHIPQAWLTPGVNQIAVSLNSHQHENWTSDNNTIVGSVFINLALPSLVLHNYSSQPVALQHNHHE